MKFRQVKPQRLEQKLIRALKHRVPAEESCHPISRYWHGRRYPTRLANVASINTKELRLLEAQRPSPLVSRLTSHARSPGQGLEELPRTVRMGRSTKADYYQSSTCGHIGLNEGTYLGETRDQEVPTSPSMASALKKQPWCLVQHCRCHHQTHSAHREQPKASESQFQFLHRQSK